MNTFKYLLLLLTAALTTTNANAQYTINQVRDSFATRTPIYETIDLVCGDAPDTTDASIVLCVPAAFSALIKPDFDHVNIAGWHYASGRLYKGFPNRNNTGGLVFYKDKTFDVFNKQDYAEAMKKDSILCAYEQCLVIFNGVTQEKYPRGKEWVANYRTLCIKDGRIFFFETLMPMPLSRFLTELEKLEVENAVYMEMGQDYNHTWWRNEDGSATIQFPFYRGSNWLVFKR